MKLCDLYNDRLFYAFMTLALLCGAGLYFYEAHLHYQFLRQLEGRQDAAQLMCIEKAKKHDQRIECLRAK